MGKFLIKLTFTNTSGDKETLEFDNKKYENLSTRSFVTNDATKPNFSAFPNEGRVILKDTDLTLFNKAINGDFDNAYNFEVDIYKGDTHIAHHIVNQRPKYDYGNKTMVLNLGNEIDNFRNTNYEGFSYPLTSTYQGAILADIFGFPLSELDYQADFENDEQIEYQIPYLPQGDKQTALNNVLQTMGCSLIKSTDKYKFIDMLGNSDNGKPIYYILPKHIRKSFVPNIILDNRFTDIKINTKNVYKQIVANEVVYKANNFLPILTTHTKKNSYSKTYYRHNSEPEAGYNPIVSVGIYEMDYAYGYKKIDLSEYQNLNLNKILEIPYPQENAEEEFENFNPTFSCRFKKTVYAPKPIVAEFEASFSSVPPVTNWNYDNYPKSYFKHTEQEEENGVTYPYVEEFDSGFLSKNTTEEIFFGDGNTDLNEKFTFSTDRFLKSPTIEKNENQYSLIFNALFGKSYLICKCEGGVDEGITSYVPGFGQLVTIEPISISVSYQGTVEEIKFDKEETTSRGGISTNIYETTNSNTLMQKGLNYSSTTNIALNIANDIYKFYENGIRTGTLSCVFGDYNSNSIEIKNIDQPFEIGDLVIPCKDNNKTPIITKNTKAVVYKVVEVEIEDNNGAGIQHLTLMETPFITETEVANVEEVSTLSLDEPLETTNSTETDNLSTNDEEAEEMSISPFSDLYGL